MMGEPVLVVAPNVGISSAMILGMVRQLIQLLENIPCVLLLLLIYHTLTTSIFLDR